MPELEYSDDALNVLGKFHSVDTMIFVEGDEDIPFWEYLFERFSTLCVKVQEVGGKPKLDKHIQTIVSGKTNVLVAIDHDYSIFDANITHPNIIRTYGYSIENTIISVDSIIKSIRSLGKIPNKSINRQEILDWLNEFSDTIEPLLVYDIENHIQGHGCVVAGSNCSRFMKTQSSDLICDKKVDKLINGLEFSITDDRAKEIILQLKDHELSVLDMIRGHFIFSAVHRYIVAYIKRIRQKISISIDSMFSTLILSFEQLFDEKHSHYAYYKSAISNIPVIT